MIDVIPANKRHFANFGWLKAHWMFSFSNYYDPTNIQFGMLRGFNENQIKPDSGFPQHTHEEIEIITIVIEGQLFCEDSTKYKTVLKPGDVHRLSAGTGITHSVLNLGTTPALYYKFWFLPDKYGLVPTYDQKHFVEADWQNRLLPIASGRKAHNVVTLHTDATVYRSNLEAGRDIRFDTNLNRRTFVYVIKGNLLINQQLLNTGDQARVSMEKTLIFRAQSDTQFFLVDLATTQGFGYDQKTLKGEKLTP